MSSTMSTGKMSRDEYKRAKELEELRKTGAAPPAVDADGNMINPHIPQFIADAPWYMQTSANSNTGLKHQRQNESLLKLTGNNLSEWYKKGRDTVKQHVDPDEKYVPGSCTNCGSRTHTAKQCLDRPRALNAKRLGRKLGADEIAQELRLSYDAKRDRWAGYNPEQYQQVVEKYERLEEQRKKLKTEDGSQQKHTNGHDDHKHSADSDSDDSTHNSSDDELKDSGALLQAVDDKTKHTVRNLRLREDTAKYLHNLNVNSAYYDPKSRSMRDNPFSANDPRAQQFANDNFVHERDDIKHLRDIESFVWDAAQHQQGIDAENGDDGGGVNVHTQALPTVVEQMYKQYQAKKTELTEQKTKEIAELYGAQDTPLPQHIKQQIQHQIDNPHHNEPAKNNQDTAADKPDDPMTRDKSMYDEDVLVGNHTAIWGSYYDMTTNEWGYACCQQKYLAAYCTGETGMQAAHSNKQLMNQHLQTATSQRQPP